MPLEKAGADGYTGAVASSEDRYMSILVTGAAGFLRPACGREAVKIFEDMQPGAPGASATTLEQRTKPSPCLTAATNRFFSF